MIHAIALLLSFLGVINHGSLPKPLSDYKPFCSFERCVPCRLTFFFFPSATPTRFLQVFQLRISPETLLLYPPFLVIPIFTNLTFSFSLAPVAQASSASLVRAFFGSLRLSFLLKQTPNFTGCETPPPDLK